MDCTFPKSNENYNGSFDQLQAIGDSATLLDRVGCPPKVGLYAHIPFCFHKCHYCDFYSIVDSADRQAAFTDRMIDELGALTARRRPVIETIFFGGGTPTLLKSELWVKLLKAMAERLELSRCVEFTVEANPETVTAELLDVLTAGGVNRISLGAQSFSSPHLKTLERWHDPENVARSVELARAAGIDNISLDLIYAIPGQSLEQWAADLDAALSLGPDHLSCYALTYEPNTALTAKMQRGRITPADNDLEAAMFDHTIDTLAGAGFEQYEISNFARRVTPENTPQFDHAHDKQAASLNGSNRCRHNLMYWHNGDWITLGPSASGHLRGVRWKNVAHLGQYLASSGGCPITDVERLDDDASTGEQLMLRLRLTDGVAHDWLSPRLTETRRAAIERFTHEGLLESTDTHLRLTRRGLRLADTVIAELL